MELLKSSIDVKPSSNAGPLVYAKPGDGPLMLLGYYRNALGHIFIHESLLTCALFIIHGDRVVTREWLKETSEYLKTILKEEYQTAPVTFEAALDSLKKKGVVEETAEGLRLAKTAIALRWAVYLSSFVWPLIECYWGAALYLLYLVSGKTIGYFTLCYKVGFNNDQSIRHNGSASECTPKEY